MRRPPAARPEEGPSGDGSRAPPMTCPHAMYTLRCLPRLRRNTCPLSPITGHTSVRATPAAPDDDGVIEDDNSAEAPSHVRVAQ